MEEKKVVGDGKKFCGKINEILWGEVRGLRGKVGWGRGLFDKNTNARFAPSVKI